ncbi:hypothetical protein AB0M46_27460 [Dactylosporangium sp. NPDC051485]|uniref:hypothetical protein n=1 Tax=Dactylosporangium sp. NPDC051485 TaxID=3154846 RepID=UPI00341F43A7
MSLFGYFIVARHDRPLTELPSIRRLCTEGQYDLDPGEACEPRADGEWGFLQVLGGWGLNVIDLAEETGFPALSVYVIESAVGIVEADIPGGSWWAACLNPADAMRVWDFPAEKAGTVEETTALAVQWAAAAGRTADPEAVAAAVNRYVGPFGEGVMAFLDGLGFDF